MRYAARRRCRSKRSGQHQKSNIGLEHTAVPQEVDKLSALYTALMRHIVIQKVAYAVRLIPGILLVSTVALYIWFILQCASANPPFKFQDTPYHPVKENQNHPIPHDSGSQKNSTISILCPVQVPVPPAIAQKTQCANSMLAGQASPQALLASCVTAAARHSRRGYSRRLGGWESAPPYTPGISRIHGSPR